MEIVGIVGPSWRMDDTPIGALTGTDDIFLYAELSKNGHVDFETDIELPNSFQFSGGLKSPGKATLANGWTIRWGRGCSTVEMDEEQREPEEDVRLALSLALGRIAFLRYRSKGRTLRMGLRQSPREVTTSECLFRTDSEGWFDHDMYKSGLSDVFTCALAALRACRGTASHAVLRKRMEWFLSARSVQGMLDFRILGLFTFFELLGGQGVSGSMSKVLGLEPEFAKQLAVVRHKVAHGEHTLKEALELANSPSQAFYEHYAPSHAEFGRPAALYDYLWRQANGVMLESIDCSLAAAGFYRNGTL